MNDQPDIFPLIGDLLEYIRGSLDDYFSKLHDLSDTENPPPTTKAVQFPDCLDPAALTLASNAVNLILISVEEDRTLRAADPYLRVTGKTDTPSYQRIQPDISLNLFLLFVACFKNYKTALNEISRILAYFQCHRVFDRLNTNAPTPPTLPPGIARLVMELAPLPIERQNDIWNALRIGHHPSLLYKAGLVTYSDRGDSTTSIEPVKERRIEVTAGPASPDVISKPGPADCDWIPWARDNHQLLAVTSGGFDINIAVNGTAVTPPETMPLANDRRCYRQGHYGVVVRYTGLTSAPNIAITQANKTEIALSTIATGCLLTINLANLKGRDLTKYLEQQITAHPLGVFGAFQVEYRGLDSDDIVEVKETELPEEYSYSFARLGIEVTFVGSAQTPAPKVILLPGANDISVTVDIPMNTLTIDNLEIDKPKGKTTGAEIVPKTPGAEIALKTTGAEIVRAWRTWLIGQVTALQTKRPLESLDIPPPDTEVTQASRGAPAARTEP